MYTDSKRLGEPWNNNKCNSSICSDLTLHYSSSSSAAAMYSPTKPYTDYDHTHASSASYNTGKFSAQYQPESETFRTDRIRGNLVHDQNNVDALQDRAYAHDGNYKSVDAIYSSGQTKGYYYDTHITEPGMYTHHQTKASIHSHTNESIQIRRNPFSEQTNLPLTVGTIHDIPGAIESESSSLDNSFDYSDSGVSRNSKFYGHQEAVTSNRNFNRHRNDYNEGYDHFAANRYDQKCATSTGLQGGSFLSHVKAHRKENSGATKCKMIEIAPGEFMRLRGAHETWKAIQDDFYLPCACFCCDLTLFCIQDATYVLCPQCQVVNPLEKIDGYDGGVGLGFTMEELAEWQSDIVANRRFRTK